MNIREILNEKVLYTVIRGTSNMIFRVKRNGKTIAEFYKNAGQVNLNKDTKYFKVVNGSVVAEYSSDGQLLKTIKIYDPEVEL